MSAFVKIRQIWRCISTRVSLTRISVSFQYFVILLEDLPHTRHNLKQCGADKEGSIKPRSNNSKIERYPQGSSHRPLDTCALMCYHKLHILENQSLKWKLGQDWWHAAWVGVSWQEWENIVCMRSPSHNCSECNNKTLWVAWVSMLMAALPYWELS